MAENTRWNKKIFAMLLEQAKGVRSWRQFATECDISYVQMRKLAAMEQENPPRPKLIRKITANAFAGCANLNSVKLNEGLTKIGGQAWIRDQYGLQAAGIADSVRAALKK